MDEGNGFSNAGNTSTPGVNPDANAPRPANEPIADTGMSGEAMSATPATQPTGIYTPNFAPTQPVTEDLVIKPSSPRGRSRRPKWLVPVIIVVVGALLVGGVLLLMNFLNNRPAPATLESTFVRFQKLLIEGPDGIELNEEVETTEPETTEPETETEVGESETTDDGTGEATGDSDTMGDGLVSDNVDDSTEESDALTPDLDLAPELNEWFLFQSEGYDLPQDQAMAYYNDLLGSYNEFARFAAETGRATEVLATYPNLLRTTVDIAMLGYLSEQITINVANDGSEKTYGYIQSILPQESDQSLINIVRMRLDAYLTAQLNRSEIYIQQGCFIEGELEQNCVANVLENDNAILESFNAINNSYNLLEPYTAPIENLFIMDSNTLMEEFKEQDA